MVLEKKLLKKIVSLVYCHMFMEISMGGRATVASQICLFPNFWNSSIFHYVFKGKLVYNCKLKIL